MKQRYSGLGWLFRERMAVLLVVLLALFVVHPLLSARGGVGGRFFANLLFLMVLIGAVNAVVSYKRVLWVVGLLAIPSVVLRWVGFFFDNPVLAHGAFALDFVLYAVISAILLLYLLRSTVVTTDKLMGALAVYLLIGLAWAHLYYLIEVMVPGSFQVLVDLGADSGAHPMAKFIYFSYVTLSTLGYGDITPQSRFAESMAALEAITGQFFLAVMIARMVGMHLASGRQESAPRDDRQD